MAIGTEEGSSGGALMTVKMTVGRGGKLKAGMENLGFLYK